MSNKLSHTSISMFTECGKKFDLHYNKKIRINYEKSALIFGKCIDNAFNELLETQNLNEALDLFNQQWGEVKTLEVKYSKSDVDEELLNWNGDDVVEELKPWCTLNIKGRLFIETFHREVLSRIKKVIAIQKPVSIKNEDGDEIAGFLDLIIEWKDGKIYLMDNKTSSVEYSETSGKESQQLVLYHYLEKDNYKLDGVGFFVLSKKINKNKVKTCIICKNETTGREKTCARIDNKIRCNGEFSLSYNPTVDVQYIFNQIEESDENKFIDIFDAANNGILNKKFEPNYNSCIGKFGKCVYYDYCTHGIMEGLIQK